MALDSKIPKGPIADKWTNHKNKQMKKTVVRYGLYGALTICILFIGSWFFIDEVNFEISEVIGYASMIVSLSFVYFGIRIIAIRKVKVK